jgi:hypothetical protein
VFGLNVDDPVDYGNMKEEDFVPGPAAEITDEVSGTPNFERSFNMATIDFQRQVRRVAKGLL